MSQTDIPKVPPPPASRKERMKIYLANRHLLPYERLLPYAGQWVALSWDGTTFLAASPDLLDLERRLTEAGIDPENVAFDRVPEDDICLGAGELE
jgi:hypothetical protein